MARGPNKHMARRPTNKKSNIFTILKLGILLGNDTLRNNNLIVNHLIERVNPSSNKLDIRIDNLELLHRAVESIPKVIQAVLLEHSDLGDQITPS